MAARSRRPLLSRVFRLLLGVLASLVIAVLALTLAWRFVPAVSTLMLGRWVTLQPVERQWVPLSAISPRLVAAVIASEDAKFCRHSGVDWGALRDVLEEADEDGPARGASTIPMQTAKNLFLWPSRSFIRKGLEIPLAVLIDLAWPKQRMIEVYLNIAEWGPGIFGAEAASRHYFKKSAADLSAKEAALLTAVLPNPIVRNAARPSAGVSRRAGSISVRAVTIGPWLDCVGRLDR